MSTTQRYLIPGGDELSLGQDQAGPGESLGWCSLRFGHLVSARQVGDVLTINNYGADDALKCQSNFVRQPSWKQAGRRSGAARITIVRGPRLPWLWYGQGEQVSRAQPCTREVQEPALGPRLSTADRQAAGVHPRANIESAGRVNIRSALTCCGMPHRSTRCDYCAPAPEPVAVTRCTAASMRPSTSDVKPAPPSMN